MCFVNEFWVLLLRFCPFLPEFWGFHSNFEFFLEFWIKKLEEHGRFFIHFKYFFWSTKFAISLSFFARVTEFLVRVIEFFLEFWGFFKMSQFEAWPNPQKRIQQIGCCSWYRVQMNWLIEQWACLMCDLLDYNNAEVEASHPWAETVERQVSDWGYCPLPSGR